MEFAESPSYNLTWQHGFRPASDYLVDHKMAKIIGFFWILVGADYGYHLLNRDYSFYEEHIHFSADVNEQIVSHYSSHQLRLQISSLISFVAAILFFFALSVWVLLLEDFGSNSIFSASLIQLLGPISVLLRLISIIITIILATVLPPPSNQITLVYFVNMFCLQLSFCFYGLLVGIIGFSLATINSTKRKRCSNCSLFFGLLVQGILSLLFVLVFLKNGLVQLPFCFNGVIWYGAVFSTCVVGVAETLWIFLYNPDIIQFNLQKFDPLSCPLSS